MSKTRLLLAATAVALTAACGRGDHIVPADKAAVVPLIPRADLFGNPDRAQARISPDGRYLSWLAPRDGVLNVWVAPADDVSAARPLTNDRDRGIRVHTWAFDNRHVGYLQDRGGDENWRAYVVNVDTGAEVELTPLDGIQARIVGMSHKHPDHIMIGINDRDDGQLHDLYRVEIATGKRELVERNPGFAGYGVDEDFNVRTAESFNPDGGRTIFSRASGDQWQPLVQISQEDSLTTNGIGFGPGGRVLYLTDSRARDTAALNTLDLDSGELATVFEHPRADVSDALVHPTTRAIQAAAANHTRVEWRVLDDAVGPDFEFLRGVANGDFHIVSRTLADDRWVVAYELSDRPLSYYLYRRDEQPHAQFLFTNRSNLEDAPLAPMHAHIIKARDGLELVSYLTLPRDAGGRGKGVPDRPLPLVLNVHGGPWARDQWGYHPEHQWLANRGYAVLSVNFRGSTGFGKAFTNAGDLEWGAAMHDDLIDAVRWAVDQRIADPQRIAIYGGSYGGYATLAGLTFTPEAFACGVDIVGPSNLITLIESIPPYWKPALSLFYTRVGDPTTAEGRALLKERSPLTHVQRIRRPLLIAQGANDPRVKQAESDQIVEAMQAREIPVTYVLYPDEGHGFARPPNRLSFYAISEAFLGQCLGGRVQPIDDAFADARLEVPAGAAYVPGLSAALEADRP